MGDIDPQRSWVMVAILKLSLVQHAVFEALYVNCV